MEKVKQQKKMERQKLIENFKRNIEIHKQDQEKCISIKTIKIF